MIIFVKQQNGSVVIVTIIVVGASVGPNQISFKWEDWMPPTESGAPNMQNSCCLIWLICLIQKLFQGH